jgi:FixJ family two-component response regulator
MIPAENQYQSTMDTRRSEAHSLLKRCQAERSAIEPPLVSIVDDDESVRESLPDLLRQFGLAVRAFSSAEEFLSSGFVDETSCLILDIAMPGMSGPELHQQLKDQGQKVPTIFISGQRDEKVREQALKQGATGFLLKPFSEAAMLASIKTALRLS